mgnify:CR=1 FL=1
MEQKKGISITKLIFSLLLVAICVFVFYTIYTKVKEKKPNVVNSNNNNASVEKKEFTKLEATKLFERIISDPAPSYSYPTKKGELLLDDMTLEQKLAIVFSNIDSNKLNKVCSTDLEDELLQNGFLSSKSVEGSECFNYYASVDDILATSKLIFGPNYTLDIENNTEKVVPYYYFENKDNDGEIMFAFYNFKPWAVTLKVGDKVGQGVFKKYLRPEKGLVINDENRDGGFGSTDKE